MISFALLKYSHLKYSFISFSLILSYLTYLYFHYWVKSNLSDDTNLSLCRISTHFLILYSVIPITWWNIYTVKIKLLLSFFFFQIGLRIIHKVSMLQILLNLKNISRICSYPFLSEQHHHNNK